MSEKRFKIYQDSIRKFESDRIWGVKSETNSLEPYMTFKEAEKCCDLLNEQQDTIITLKRRLEKINGGYGHLTHRNGLTANEWVIEGQERELKKKNEEISDWIEQHSKDIVKIGEQQSTIRRLQDLCGESDGENAKLRIENKRLQEEKGYWESKAMTLLMQVRRLTSRMTDKEVKEFSKELEDE